MSQEEYLKKFSNAFKNVYSFLEKMSTENFSEKQYQDYVNILHAHADLMDTNVEDLDSSYCQQCGACGESGCCSPNKCLYLNDYKKDYRELEMEHEKMYKTLLCVLSKEILNITNNGMEPDRKILFKIINALSYDCKLEDFEKINNIL